MEILTVGLSHKTAPVDVRERLNFPEKELAPGLGALNSQEIAEKFILSTCNRVEVYAAAEDPLTAREEIIEFLSAYHHLPRPHFEPFLYTKIAEEAVKHIFRVASSLDALVVGEPQVLGQVKEAYAIALECEATGVVLNNLLEKAIWVAKKVRTETGIAEAAVSVSSAAVDLAKKIFGTLSTKTVMILGAGKMSELAAKHLLSDGATSVLVANRTYERALELAEKFQGRAIKYDEAFQYMISTDIVISSTGAPHFIVSRADAERIIHARKQKPIFFIDIAVPRDIDPAVNEIDNVYVYDIDDLKGVVEVNLRERHKEAEKAEHLVDKEVRHFIDWFKTLEVVPTIVDIRKKVEAMRLSEVEKTLSKLGGDQDLEKALHTLTQALVNKILHEPLTQLKQQSGQQNGHMTVKAARKLFGLDKEEKDK